jgi:hypothetical protein
MKPCVRKLAKRFEGALFSPARKNQKKVESGKQTTLEGLKE